MNFIDRLYDKKISSKGLGLFRILFSLVLLCEVFRIFRYRQLYFDPMPFIERNLLSSEIAFTIWICVLLMLMIGAYTRIAALLNYIFVLVFLSHIGSYEYHMDYTYVGVSFLMIFISVNKSFSIDRLRGKLKFSSSQTDFIPIEKTSVLSYWLIVFFGVALVYLTSVFLKIQSNAWLNGLGLWLPASIPQITIINNQWFLNQEYLIKFLGYFTLAFEFLLIFIFWIKSLRLILFVIGVFLHLGILIEFPIPYFGLGYIAIYILLIPVGFWSKLFDKFKSKSTKINFFYSADDLMCTRLKIVLEHFDWFNNVTFSSTNDLNNDFSVTDKNGKSYLGLNAIKKALGVMPILFPLRLILIIPGVTNVVKYLFKVFVSSRPKYQINNIEDSNSSFVRSFKILSLKLFIITALLLQLKTEFNNPFKNGFFKSLYSNVDKASSKFLGITQHTVFLDGHYDDYDTIYTLTYNDEFLPLLDEFGMPDDYIVGGIWADFGFRVNMPNAENNLDQLKHGLSRYAAFYAHKNGVNLEDAEFVVLRKNVRASYEWEEDLLLENRMNPWSQVGLMTWTNFEVEVNIEVDE